MKQIEVDVVVVGSGAGGMTTALCAHEMGLTVIVIEKSEWYGGSTAMSGGGVWIPGNYVTKAAGDTSTIEQIIEYLKHVTAGEVSESKLRMYAEKGPEMLEYLREKAPELAFRWSRGYSDYHPNAPHGSSEGRSIEPDPFNVRKLKSEAHYLHPTDIKVPLGMWLTGREYRDLSMVMRTWEGRKVALKVGMRTVANWFTGRKMVALGQALAGRLRYALMRRSVEVWRNAPLKDIMMTNGRATGVLLTHNGEDVEITARRGVVLAMGGFDHNATLRTHYLPDIAREDNSAGARDNVGDAVAMMQRHDIAMEYLDEAWWMPSVRLPNGSMFPLVSERAIPRSIIVGENGKRFANEALPYVTFVHEQLKKGEKTAWHILDAKAFARYMYAGNPPGLPIPRSWYASGLAVKAPTIQELADKIGVDANGLSEQLQTYNASAVHGEDPEYNRGGDAYQRYYGDPSLTNPNVDSIDTAPYYAIKIVIGDLGTKGGVAVNEYAQVLKNDGTHVEGLYATGNVSGSVMGREYAGAGATIGPAMVFGYVAAQDMAQK